MAKGAIREFRTSTGVELVMTEPISQWTAERLIADLSRLKGEHVTLSIFSGGGDAFAGFAIHDYITDASNGLKVEARVYGMAASAAMIIAAACSPRLIGESSMGMVHNAFSMSEDVSEKDQAVLDNMNERQVEIFRKVTGMTAGKLTKLMEEDRFMDADEAVALGFFTGKIEQAKLAALLTNKTMSKPDTRTFKVSAGEALKAIASGTIEVPASEVEGAEAATIDALNAKIAELEGKLSANDTAIAEATAKVAEIETAKAAEAKAKETVEAELVATKEVVGKYVATIEALKKNPLVAQVLPDGTSVVIPGAPPEAPKAEKTKGEERQERVLSGWAESIKRVTTKQA